jgi:SH3-like domain-containing protein
MKTLLNILISLFFIGNSAMSQNINQIIDDTKKKLAPDKRTSIFNVNFEKTSDKIILRGEVSNSNYKVELISELKNRLKSEIIDSIEVLPSKKLGTKIYALVNLSVCNIRSNPDHPAELSTQALMGTPVKVYKEQGGWYLIQTPDEYLGWVDDDGLALKTAAEMQEWTKSKKMIYKNISGLVYSDKNLTQVLSDAVAGNVFELINESDKYFEVKLPDGRQGFIKSNEAEDFDKWFSKLTFDAESIISFGKNMIGFPYLWGGTSVKGIDCSGFMKTIHFLNGLILPRDANQQALIGDEIQFDSEFSQLKPGDLIFFGRKGNEVRPERITHVGIYLGNKKFLHSSGRVRLDSFDKKDKNYNEYRLNTIVRIKRILGNKDLIETLKIINNKFYKSESYQ